MSPKTLSAKTFREEGLLQEVNRRFFHPLGLALFLDEDPDTGELAFGGVYDYRDDAEGVRYGWEPGTAGHQAMVRRAMKVDLLWDQRAGPRVEALGYMVQPAEEAP